MFDQHFEYLLYISQDFQIRIPFLSSGTQLTPDGAKFRDGESQ